uniref:Uncharacterized protein n=1 Tax=Ixodes ricinus TaxID=34613 RepID=A0A6B0TTG3_IXORI
MNVVVTVRFFLHVTLATVACLMQLSAVATVARLYPLLPLFLCMYSLHLLLLVQSTNDKSPSHVNALKFS